MVADLRNDLTSHQPETARDQFLALLPQIRRLAMISFRRLGTEAREELVQEVIANAFRAWDSLIRKGKGAVAYATPLAQFAIRQVRAGRRVGCRQNTRDILSGGSRGAHGLKIERINRRDPRNGDWDELLLEDRKAGPAETAAARIDIAEWLRTLSKRNQGIARSLALGATTNDVARKFGLSAGRVSQIRTLLLAHWQQYQDCDRSIGCVA
jgi:RNA polymerase sigma factor (sigma-70 family)